jgi:hypothetical protein
MNIAYKNEGIIECILKGKPQETVTDKQNNAVYKLTCFQPFKTEQISS